MKDLLRTLFSIRKPRRPAAVGPLPEVGSAIVRGRLKMTITQPVPRDLWDWLVLSGWRNPPIRHDRRKCQVLPPHTLQALIAAPAQERNQVHADLLAQTEDMP